MPPAERDAALLWDMLRACREMHGFMQDVELDDFVADRKLCLAVERCLEIAGEAAGDVSAAFCAANPQIAWRQITGMRHILAHDYGTIDYAIVYRTVTDDVPGLLTALESSLAP